MSKPDLFIAPVTDGLWSNYCGLCEQQYNYTPFRTDKVVLVASDDSGYIHAGCVLINSDGPYLIANGVVIDKELDKTDQYNAFVFLQDELKRLSAVLRKTVMILTNHPGLIRIVSKHGYLKSVSELWFYSATTNYVYPVYDTAITPKEEAVAKANDIKEAVNKNLDSEADKYGFDIDEDTKDLLRPKKTGQIAEHTLPDQGPPKRRSPGRPRGSKNKKKV